MYRELTALHRDILPRLDLHRERREERHRVLLRSRRDAVTLGILFLLAAAILVPLTLHLGGLREELRRARRETAALEKHHQEVAQLSAAIDRQLQYQTQYVEGRNRRLVWGDTLCALAARIPAGAYLENIIIEGQNGQAQVALQGSAEAISSVKDFNDSLTRTPLFTQVRLTEATASPSAGARSVHFRIEARTRGALTDPAARGKTP